jgi:wyosine [tRNA(Phe)-imidazoG37] synthetase (radical SAM superfamily)
VPSEARTLRDIAIAGNGEPTSARELEAVIELVGRVLDDAGLRGRLEVVLITNGSLVHRDYVQRALAKLRELGGVVWFKLDGATDAALARVNSNAAGVQRSVKNLELCASLCPTWVQTLALDFGGSTLAGAELGAYCALLADLRGRGVELRGVLLYGLARPSHQPEAPRLRALPRSELEAIAQRVREASGLEVRVHE